MGEQPKNDLCQKTFRDVSDKLHREFIIACKMKGLRPGEGVMQAMKLWMKANNVEVKIQHK